MGFLANRGTYYEGGGTWSQIKPCEPIGRQKSPQEDYTELYRAEGHKSKLIRNHSKAELIK